MPKHHGMRFPPVIGGPGSAGGGGAAPFTGSARADFSTNEDLNEGAGVLTGTLSGGDIVVTGGALVTNGNGLNYCSWGADNNFEPITQGCIRCQVEFNYSGSPPNTNTLLSRGRSSGNNNGIALWHSTLGQIGFLIYDSASAALLGYQVTSWSPTAGVTYEIEYNFDLTAQEHRVFIDGVQLGATYAGTAGTLADETGNFIRCGAWWDTTNNASNFKMKDIKLFESVQHTANYTP